MGAWAREGCGGSECELWEAVLQISSFPFLGPFLGVPSQRLSTPFKKLSLKMGVLVSQAPSSSCETPGRCLR